MANRNTLHRNKLAEFVGFLISRGYVEQPAKSVWEAVRMVNGELLGSARTVIIYERIKGGKQHLTVQDKDFKLLREFLYGS